MRLLPVCALVAALAAWSPAAATGQVRDAIPEGLVTTSDGRDVIAFTTQPDGAVVLAVELPDGSFDRFAQTRGTDAARTVAFAGGDEIVGAYGAFESTGSGSRWYGGAVFAGPPRPGLGPALDAFPRGPHVPTRSFLAANRRGDAAAVVRGGKHPPHVLMRRAGGRFRRPVAPLARMEPSHVAVLDDGSAIVVGGGPREGHFAAVVDAAGRPGRLERLGPAGVSHELLLATGPGGQAAVLWRVGGPIATLYFARRPGAGEPFGRPIAAIRLPHYGPIPAGLALDASGRAVVVWGQADGTGPGAPYRYRAATIDPGGAVGAPVWLTDAGDDPTNFPKLAANEHGRLVFAWEQTTPADGGAIRTEVVARAGRTDGAFGPPQRLTAPNRSAYVSLHASVAPTGRASVLWSDRPLGSPSGDPRDTRLWVSHLDAGGAVSSVAIPYAAPPPLLLPELAPPLREARILSRAARPGAGGRVRLRLRCRSWILLPCRGAVQLDGAARASFSVRPGATAPVVVRLGAAARRRLARRGRLRLAVRVQTAGPRGGSHRRTLVIRR